MASAAPTRIHEITCTAAGATKLLLRSLSGHESLGRPFEYFVEMYCDKADLKPSDFLGAKMAISVMTDQETKAKRYFHGLIASFCYAGGSGREQVYRAVLRPWFWFLTRTTDCRIFQKLDIKQILAKVFRDKNKFTDFKTDKLGAGYRVWDFCVQYRESDFDFASRLMEQEGIYYYFEHTETSHMMVLCDAPNCHTALTPDPEIPFRVSGEGQLDAERIASWLRTESVQTASFQYRDFDFEKQPNGSLQALAKLTPAHKEQNAFEQYDYPGEFVVAADGTRYAKIRSQEIASQYSVAVAHARSYRLAVGTKFKMIDFPSQDIPRAQDNIEYLVTSTQIDVVSGEVGFLASDKQNLFEIQLTAIDSKQNYRAPQVTPRPRITGPQTAIVVGQANSEIWTDKFGRVKVQFHWDREGKFDENSSCWIRVSQLWAGKQWGGIHIPRVGQEVIVEFLEGDPDRPIVTGRVYNAEQTVPYIQGESIIATQSGIKSRSTLKGDVNTFNEFRFEDAKGKEQVYLHAEKDMERVVENNDVIKVGFDKKDPGDQTITIHNNQKLTVGNGQAQDGSQTIEIWKNRTETVKMGNEKVTVEMGNRDVTISKGDETLTVGLGKRTTKIFGDDSLTVQTGNLSVDVTVGKITMKALQSIELIVGGSSIKIDPAQIALNAPMIKINGQAMVDVKAPITMIDGSALLKLSGGIVLVN